MRRLILMDIVNEHLDDKIHKFVKWEVKRRIKNFIKLYKEEPLLGFSLTMRKVTIIDAINGTFPKENKKEFYPESLKNYELKF